MVKFWKMNGAGNDFVVLDNRDMALTLSKEQIAAMCHRQRGIGADGLLAVEPARNGADYRMRYYNADGGEAEMCGNGARCFAAFVRQRRLTGKRIIKVETAGGNLILKANADHSITVDMGAPILTPADIPFLAERQAVTYELPLADRNLIISAVSMGNPHAVIEVEDLDIAPVRTLGPRLQRQRAFPDSANIGFAQVLDPSRVRLRVYERGAGETRACGSGASAAAAVLMRRGRVERAVDVALPGGTLRIEWPRDDAELTMAGPAAFVFEGEWTQ